MYLLDTNVISETRKNRPHGAVLAWLDQIPTEAMFLSAITIGELQDAAERTRRTDIAKALELEAWILTITSGALTILPVDSQIAREWARMMSNRSDTLLADGLIAATARIHRLTVVTRDVKDFRMFDVPVLNPFSIPKLH